MAGAPAPRQDVERLMAVRERGFTLVELMVAIAVMGLLLVAVSPALNDWAINLRIRNTASAVEQGLQLARQEAIRRNQAVGFYFVSSSAADSGTLNNSCALSSTDGSWVVSVRSPAGKCATAPSTTVDPMIVNSHPVGDGGRGVAVSATQADKSTAATTVTFNGLGSVTNAGAVARVDITAATNSNRYRSLCVELSGIGAPRVCDPALAASDPRACRGACT